MGGNSVVLVMLIGGTIADNVTTFFDWENRLSADPLMNFGYDDALGLIYILIYIMFSLMNID